MSDSFSCESSNTGQGSQLWLNVEGQSLKKEVNELQKILDEISQNSRLVQQQIQQKGYNFLASNGQKAQSPSSSNKTTNDSPLTQRASKDTHNDDLVIYPKHKFNVTQELVNNGKGSQKQQQLKVGVYLPRQASNLKQPTKITRPNLSSEKTDQSQKSKSTNQKTLGKQKNMQQKQIAHQQRFIKDLSRSVLDDSLDTSIKNKYAKLIRGLDEEIIKDIQASKLKQKQEIQPVIEYFYDSLDTDVASEKIKPVKERQKIEVELEKLKQTLEMIKEQEIMLITQIQQDDVAKTSARHESKPSISQTSGLDQSQNQTLNKLVTQLGEDESTMLAIDGEEPVSDSNSFISQLNKNRHVRRISRQSFGCRSMQDIKNQLKDNCDYGPNNQLFNLDISGFGQMPACNMPLQINVTEIPLNEQQITTPRTTNIEDIQQLHQLNTSSHSIQTPFFSRNLHTKKQSRILENDPILAKMTENIDIKLREENLSPDLNYVYKAVEIQHAFNTSRSNSKNLQSRELNSTPRENVSLYCSQRSQSRGSSKHKLKNNFDYSKMSKHQSIAKLFENRHNSKKQSTAEKEENFELKRQSSSYTKIPDRLSISSQARQDQEVANFQTRSKVEHQFQSSDKKQLSSSKDKYSYEPRNQDRQSIISQKEPFQRRELNLQGSQSKTQLKDYLNTCTPQIHSSRNPSTQKSYTNPVASQIIHAIQKDRSLVKLRKQELEQERQVKLIMKIQQKENKINTLVSKKTEEEKQRKEPQVIYQKTQRLKQRIDDRRRQCVQQKIQETTPDKSLHQSLRDENSKTPSRNNRDQIIQSLFRKTQSYKVETLIDKDSRSPQNVKIKLERAMPSRNFGDKTIASKDKHLIIVGCNNKFSHSSNNISNLTKREQQHRVQCENCQKLFQKGLSSNYCPMHSKQLCSSNQSTRHSQQPSNMSYGEITDTQTNSSFAKQTHSYRLSSAINFF